MARRISRHYYFRTFVSFPSLRPDLCQRLNAYVRTIVALLGEYYCTINQCEEGVVLAHTYVLAWVVNCTTLTNDDVACLSKLTTEKLQTESFAL